MKKEIRNNRIVRAATVFFFVLFTGTLGASAATGADYWPTNGWRVTSPEKQGMNTAALADMMEFVHDRQLNVDSITIVRNGYIVLDTYIYPFPKNTKHHLCSCSKSVVSALIGIAIEKGYIENVKQPVLNFFPEISVGDANENKKKITIENLLTMTTSLDSREGPRYKHIGMYRLFRSENWTRYILDLPMKEPPGERFEYSNAATYLLSDIIRRTTGMGTLDFARKHLFTPLGITDASWDASPQGIDMGFSRLWLNPHDMAKIGWLYLNDGRWGDTQVVPADWVNASVRGRVEAGPGFSHYGYQWWVGDGFYVAVGYMGQFIFVAPEKNVVAVFTGTSPMRGPFSEVRDLFKNYILPSAVSGKPLPPNPKEWDRLKKLETAINTLPEKTPVHPVPAIASTISGKTYVFDTNRMGLESLSLTFTQGSSEAWLKMVYRGRTYPIAIGLDNRFRITDVDGRLYAYKGTWVEDNIFTWDHKYVGDVYWGDCRLEFKNKDLKFYGFDRSSNITYEAMGKQSETGE